MDSENDTQQDIRTPVHENRDPTSHRCLPFGARQSLCRNGLISVTGNVISRTTGMHISSQVNHGSLIVAPVNLANCDGRTLHDSCFSVGTFHQTESIGSVSQFTAGNGRGVERTGGDSVSSTSKSSSCFTSNASNHQDIATRPKMNIIFSGSA